jgi:hypothetical protein
MTSDWGAYCTSNDLAIDGDQITVSFTDERSHRVTVTEEPHQLHLEAIVVRPATVRSLKADLAALIWERNRTATLVGFRIDERDRLVCQAWMPKAGLTAEEFRAYVRTVAVESDRLEYELTGKDIE